MGAASVACQTLPPALALARGAALQGGAQLIPGTPSRPTPRLPACRTPPSPSETGGPGCSSLLAAFTENGPCLVPEKGADRGKAVFNPYAWNSNATVVWLDQPAGVGFSWGTENDKDEAGAAKDAYAFLQAFFKAHTALQALPFFVVGESYGGHYTPALTYAVSQGNKVPGNLRINLKGVGVGNGLTVPLAQYPEYSTLAYNFTMEKLGKPVITLDVYKQMQAELKVCLPAIAACANDTAVCALAQSVCNNAQIGPYESTGLNPYDFRIPCEVPGLCYDESGVTAFFNEPAIQKALHVDSHATTWQTCNYNVNGQFSSDWMKQFAEPYISSQLEEGTRVLVSAPCTSARALARLPLPLLTLPSLPPTHPPGPQIYAGDVDFICNWLGNQAWTLGLEWSGKAGFNAAEFKDWAVGGASAGLARTYGGLTFLRVFDAGHMVP